MHLEIHILLFLYISVGPGATYNESYFEPTQQNTCPLITSFDNVDLTCESTWKVEVKTGTRVGPGSECWPSNGLKNTVLKCLDGIWVHDKDRQRLKRSGNCPEVQLEATNGKICKVHDYVVYPVTGFNYQIFDVPSGKCYPEGTTELMASLSLLRVPWCFGSVTVKVHYCPPLPYFNYGSKHCSGDRENVYGSTCNFSCNNGYTLDGPRSITCGTSYSKTSWSSRVPSCKLHYCPPLPYFNYGSKHCSGDRENVYGSTCNFSCNNGYTLDGPRSITCGTSYSKTSWSSRVPSCKLQDCPPLLYFNFGSKSCSGDRENVYGSTCNFSCNNGYTLDGPRSITCGTYNSKSDWSSRAPSCKVQYCPPLQNFTFGVKQCSGDKENVYGSTCNFCCHSGYILNGPQNITCGTVDSKPTWSENAPSCIAMRKGDQCTNT